jgi:hypothetical protein
MLFKFRELSTVEKVDSIPALFKAHVDTLECKYKTLDYLFVISMIQKSGFTVNSSAGQALVLSNIDAFYNYCGTNSEPA